ncbi:MAG: cytochrome P450 [Epibacterium sp.]|nr:cytochrome P450 [Epibacterium sp.]NQX73070.1 cytochrome P450 [Epibacterium sp.]
MNSRPPKPPSRPDRVSLWRYFKLFRQDILSAQPVRLYRAKMAEFRTPFFRSYLLNQPDLVDEVLKARPQDFPKSNRIAEGLRPLLGNSVFLTNGATWERQRRIIDPAFKGGRLKDSFDAILQAAEAGRARLRADGTPLEIEAVTAHIATDVIFRTLFSIPIEHEVAAEVFNRFRAYQKAQPILNLAAFVPLPRWVPRFFPIGTRKNAARIRRLITDLTTNRMEALRNGSAPQDLATKIMTTTDPKTGEGFSTEDMVDQVAIFFLAGHETSASALSWALYLLARDVDWQDKLAQEAACVPELTFGNLSKLKLTRDVFREALRLYPPVPMMVRETIQPELFRDREIPDGAQLVLSPWHQHRHELYWDNPDAFDPGRWQTEAGKASARRAYMPFSAGARVCTGAAFAMLEGVLILATLLRDYRFATVEGRDPEPVAHLTVRSRNGIWLKVTPRDRPMSGDPEDH